MTKGPIGTDWQNRMQALFRESGREGYREDTGNPVLNQFDERVEKVKAKLSTHLERHSPVWIGRETFKLIEENIGKLQPKLTPKWIVQTETSPSALAQKAYANVEHRNLQRIEKLNQITNRMRQQIKPDDPDGSPKNRNKIGM